jgi:hypothetical protein
MPVDAALPDRLIAAAVVHRAITLNPTGTPNCHIPHVSLALLSRVSDPSVDVLLLLRRRTTAGLPAAPAGCAMPLLSGSWLPAPDEDLLVI